jgi:hypothetical protein
MQITTRTAVIPNDAIQTAYNDAVMSGRMALAREIGQLWLSMLAEQKVTPLVPTTPRPPALQVTVAGAQQLALSDHWRRTDCGEDAAKAGF